MRTPNIVMDNVLNRLAEEFDELAEAPLEAPLEALAKRFAAFQSKASRLLGLDADAFLKATEPRHSVEEPSNWERRQALQSAAVKASQLLKR